MQRIAKMSLCCEAAKRQLPTADKRHIATNNMRQVDELVRIRKLNKLTEPDITSPAFKLEITKDNTLSRYASQG